MALLLALAMATACSDKSASTTADAGPPEGRSFWSPEGIASSDKYILVANTAIYMEGPTARWDRGFVTVIDRRTHTVLGKVYTSARNTQTVHVRGTTAYVVSSGETSYKVGMVTPTSGGALDIIDLAPGPPFSIKRTINLPLGKGDPRIGAFGDVELDPTAKVAYLGSGTRGDLFKVDLVQGKVLRGADNPIAIFPTKAGHNGLTKLRPWGSDGIAIINLNSEELCWSKDWAGDLAKRTCHSIKVQKNQFLAPLDLAWASDGAALVLMTLGNALYRVDVKASPFKVTGKCLSTGLSPNRVLLHGGKGYIINSLTGNLQRFDPASCKGDNPFVVFPSGSIPYDMVITKETAGDIAWV